jgi:hypothetical protein
MGFKNKTVSSPEIKSSPKATAQTQAQTSIMAQHDAPADAQSGGDDLERGELIATTFVYTTILWLCLFAVLANYHDQ